MDQKTAINFVEQIIHGYQPSLNEFLSFSKLLETDFKTFLPITNTLREQYFGKKIHLCSILNAKSGKCSEDCSFCPQSIHYQTTTPEYPLLTEDSIVQKSLPILNTPIDRFSAVTSGKKLSLHEVKIIAKAFQKLQPSEKKFCASLGILDQKALQILKEVGITRYHHNLETAESFFKQICTTHSYQDRLQTIQTAQELGLSICSGGLFGMGESDQQVIELGLTLKELKVDAVPINFLIPISGTPLANIPRLTPVRCLKIIMLLRLILIDKNILICGGRENNLQNFHDLIFQAGANGIMTGNYLTKSGSVLEDDLNMLEKLKLIPNLGT